MERMVVAIDHDPDDAEIPAGVIIGIERTDIDIPLCHNAGQFRELARRTRQRDHDVLHGRNVCQGMADEAARSAA